MNPTVRRIVAILLRDNQDLREIKYRRLIQEIVEDKIGKKISPEVVPRICRELQNTLHKYEPDPKDRRWELEKEWREHYANQNN